MRSVKTQDGRVHYIDSDIPYDNSTYGKVDTLVRSLQSKFDKFSEEVEQIKASDELVSEFIDSTALIIDELKDNITNLGYEQSALNSKLEVINKILRNKTCKFFGKLFKIYYIENDIIYAGGKVKYTVHSGGKTI